LSVKSGGEGTRGGSGEGDSAQEYKLAVGIVGSGGIGGDVGDANTGGVVDGDDIGNQVMHGGNCTGVGSEV